MPDLDVIFVDDEPSLTEIFQHYVLWKYKDWRFATFSNSVLAYNDVVTGEMSARVWIIDLMMPGKNGVQLATAIRSIFGDRPVILAYTALDRQSLHVHEQYKDGLHHFNNIINKKEDISDVLSLVDVWIVK